MDVKTSYENVKKHIDGLSPLIKSWNFAKKLFHKEQVEETLMNAVKLGKTKLALIIFILAAIIATSFSIITLIESVQLTNFTSDTVTEITGMDQVKVEMPDIMQMAIIQVIGGLLLAPILNILCELLAFKIAKITGGKGTFEKQFYLASVISLSLAMMSVITLALPIPCIQIVGGIILIIGMVYFWMYVSSKAYMLVHDITFTHAFVIMLVTLFIRFGVMVYALNLLAVWLNLSDIFKMF